MKSAPDDGTGERQNATKHLETPVTPCSTSAVRSCSPVLLIACLLGIATAAAPAADPPPDPVGGAPLPPTAAPPPEPPMITPNQEVLNEIIVETTEPQFVAPTRRDRIGRIWAPVLIDGKGPYRLVLDTGANRSAITAHTAQLMGVLPSGDGSTVVTGFTGSARVPTIHVDHMEVGELLLGPTVLPILSDVFGGAQGVLGIEGLTGMRVYADFGRDRLVIARSHGERAGRDFTVVPLRLIRGGLLVADVHVGSVRAKAIVDTGAQGTSGRSGCAARKCRTDPRTFRARAAPFAETAAARSIDGARAAARTDCSARAAAPAARATPRHAPSRPPDRSAAVRGSARGTADRPARHRRRGAPARARRSRRSRFRGGRRRRPARDRRRRSAGREAAARPTRGWW